MAILHLKNPPLIIKQKTPKNVYIPEKIIRPISKPVKVVNNKADRRKETLDLFIKNFPKLFSLKKRIPLSKTVKNDLCVFFEGKISKRQITATLRYYVTNNFYLNGIICKSHRYNLEGEKAELILEQEKEYSQKKLEVLKQFMKKMAKVKYDR
jgi:sRNA-binding protein